MGLNTKKLTESLIERGCKPEDLESAIKQLKELNKAVKHDDSIWAEGIENSSKSYYQLYYCKKSSDGRLIRTKLWIPCLMDNSGTVGKYWFSRCFASNAIGMNRKLDAMNHVFNLLKSCGGTYSQVYC